MNAIQNLIGKTVPLVIFLFGIAICQTNPVTVIKAGKLIDGKSDKVQENVLIVVEKNRIKEITRSMPAGATIIDLSNSTVMPGLIDNHTHVLLQGDITSEDYDVQLLKESIPYRTLRASAACKTALLNGFTTIRDVETEGAMYADVDLKKAIENGIIPGPRMFVSTRALAPTGRYPLRGYSWEIRVPQGVQITDGVENLIHAVREQVSFGADWVKFYCDSKYYISKDGKVRSWLNYRKEEMEAIVSEAHRLGKKVAAHAVGYDGIKAALDAGVDTIEHGDGFTEDLMQQAIRQNAYWCPTIHVTAYVMEGRAKEGNDIWLKLFDYEAKAFSKAIKMGVKISLGTDAGGFAWTENQAKEFTYMVKWGMTPMQAIKSATAVAAELLDMQDKLGAVAPGYLADIVAVKADPLQNIEVLQQVSFVMKDGVVYKNQ